MCRSGNESPATVARRCPCDTSANRRMRRHNALARKKFSPVMVAPSAPVIDVVGSEGEGFVVADAERFVGELIGALPDSLFASREYSQEALDNVLKDYDESAKVARMVVEAGAAVRSLAVEKYGAPTDEEFRERWESVATAWRERREFLEGEIERLNEERRIVRDEIFDKGVVSVDWSLDAYGADPAKVEEFILTQSPDVQALIRKEHALRAEAKPLNDEKWDGKPDYSVMVALVEKRSEAYLTALEDVGVVLSDGSQLVVAENSHSKAARVLRDSLKHYPAAWVEGSNALSSETGVGLRVKDSTARRAHYNRAAGQKTANKRLRHGWTTQVSLTEGVPAEVEAGGLEATRWVEAEVHYDGLGEPAAIVRDYDGVAVHRHSIDVNVPVGVKSWWVKVPMQTKFSDGKPAGNGWRKHVVDGGTVWTRLPVEKTMTVDKVQAEITITRGRSGAYNTDSGMSVAVHEFAHRVEDSVRGVRALEEAFLVKRARLHTPASENLLGIGSARSEELGYADSFPAHYMGKVYKSGSRELLSCGMEMVFAGEYGAGVGAKDNVRPDGELRDFVLGLLATSIRHKQ